MKNSLIFPVVMLFSVACARDKDMRADQKSYEVVEEGSASGVTSTIQGPGETLPPMTDTNVDTTTAFTIDPNTTAAAPANRTISGTPPAQTVTDYQPPPTSRIPGYTPPEPPAEIQAKPPAEPQTKPEPKPAPPPTKTDTTAPPTESEDDAEDEEEPPPPTTTDTRGNAVADRA